MPETEIEKLRVVSFIQPQPLSEPFIVWPQHMVFIDWFKSSHTYALEAVQEAAKKVPRVEARAGRLVLNKDTKEYTVIFTPESVLEVLFIAVLNELNNRNIKPYEDEALPPFRPEIALKQGHPGITSDQLMIVDHLALVRQSFHRTIKYNEVMDYALLKAGPDLED